MSEALGNESSIPSLEPEEKYRKGYLTSLGKALSSKQMKPIVKYSGCIDTEDAEYKEGQNILVNYQQKHVDRATAIEN